ncbi:WD40-repeat-containing domain protein [Suillus occidentalis]|nr:WD40-repeat-containing domain protein [Suillus occidentalis]
MECQEQRNTDSTKFATAGYNETGVKIMDAKTGELFTTLKHGHWVRSVAWTFDGKKLISGSWGSIRIFDTATWKQIATLDGHTNFVNAITLSRNDRLLASISEDKTARLWNLDTNLQVGPPLQHDHWVQCAALSADGQVLATGGYEQNVYAWDIRAILNETGFEDLLLPIPHIDATRRPPIHARRIPPRFFDDMQGDIHSSTSRGNHHPSSHRVLLPSMESARTFLARIPSFFHHSHSYTSEATELQQTAKQGIFSRHGPRTVEVAAVQDKKAFLFSCAFQCTPFNYLCSPCLLLRGQKASSSRAANHMATSHHRKLSPPTHRRLPHSLELTLRHQVQQPHNDDDASHCGLVSCFFSVVHLLHTSMVVDAVAYAHLSYFRF